MVCPRGMELSCGLSLEGIFATESISFHHLEYPAASSGATQNLPFERFCILLLWFCLLWMWFCFLLRRFVASCANTTNRYLTTRFAFT